MKRHGCAEEIVTDSFKLTRTELLPSGVNFVPNRITDSAAN